MPDSHSGKVTRGGPPTPNFQDPDIPGASLRPQNTDTSAGHSDIPSSRASPFAATKVQEISYKIDSAGKSTDSKINNPSSITSSVSKTSKYPLNVSDWNEKVVRETTSTNIQPSPEHAVDPPRSPRAGHEWVWFSEGYWAERESFHNTSKNRKSRQKWFSLSKGRRHSGSRNSKIASSNSTSNKRLKVGESKTSVISPRKGTSVGDNISSADSRGSRGAKLLKGLRHISPFRPQSTLPASEHKDLPRKPKRGLLWKRKAVRHIHNQLIPIVNQFHSISPILQPF
jgi:hypothetical protein